ncbi:alpha/beta fold hydrolase [Streptomyces sp. HPF1205]|uniref:alpha/beta fold hydrolase n=1 Tax=Streptomyces sp. HPF1205 TaxID=2873262 RepID=UPI001CEDBFC8|nr:alpha/beta fold hydrolase [Streptomyces sp. HPF1205]
MEEVTVHRVNGVSLACGTRGPAGGPPLLLLHALGESRASWRKVAAGLAADGWLTRAPDLRGHGDSAWPGTYAYEEMRDDVLGLLDALGLDRVTIVAHSMGTVVASLVAMDRPAAVGRMVLEEGPLPFPADPPRPVPTAAPDTPYPFDWRLLPAVARQRNAPAPRHWEGLADITAPTLVVAGGPGSHLRQDQLARTADRIPNGRLVTIEAGHMIHDERPAEFLAVVRDFLGAPPA